MRARNIKLRLAMILIACLIALSSIGVTQAAWFSIKVPGPPPVFIGSAYTPTAVSAYGDSCHPLSLPNGYLARWVTFRVSSSIARNKFRIDSYNPLNFAHIVGNSGLDGVYEVNLDGTTTIKLCGRHEWGYDAWSYRLFILP